MVSSNSSLLFQGLQKSCLAPLILEPSVSTHQLAPSKQDLVVLPLSKKQSETELCENQKHWPPTGNKNGSWDFLQAPKKTSSYSCKPATNDTVYVHPLTKSCSWMSTRSLEMCTETLGSETGTHIMDESTYLAIMEKRSSCGSEQPTKTCKKIKHVTSFPPPLTSIVGGGGGVEMRARREEGRLVIEAVASSSRSCFKAERENGRLRLSLVKDECNYCGFEKEEKEVEVEVENKRREDGRRVGRRIGGGEWPSSRCSGDGRNNLSSLPFYVAIS
ncbi:hypothetical protein ACP275_14G209800 [Erythranthe tilingii]